MKRLCLIWTAPGLFLNRLIWITLRIGLVTGLAVTILFYVLAVGGVTIFDRQFPILVEGNIGMLLGLHDFLSLLLIGYWIHLVRHLRRRDTPLFPFLVFFLYSIVEPYLLLGEHGPTFISTCRPWTFYLSCPMALLVLTAWLLMWGSENLNALFLRGRQGDGH